jgi:hypothetical protein
MVFPSALATNVDAFAINGLIQPAETPQNYLRRATGRQVAQELGGRVLLRYVLPHQLGAFTSGSRRAHYVTPTPYAPTEAGRWLALPRVGDPRTHVLWLNPGGIRQIWGPRWVLGGRGIEYFLPQGFGRKALVIDWEVEIW